MTPHILITFAIIATMVLLFVSNRVPVAVVALSATLVLYATGILELFEALAGFGDTTILFIASLFVVSASLDSSGVTTWAGQVLIRYAGESRTRLLVLSMLLVAFLTALIGSGGAVAALLPVLVIVSVRLKRPPAQLMMPLAFASYSGSMLVLTGSLVNVLLSDAASDVGLAPFGFFEMTVIGVPLLAGTVAIVILFGDMLLPVRTSREMPEDLSHHSRMLTEQYKLFDQVYQLEITAASPYRGTLQAVLESRLERENHPELSFIAIRPRRQNSISWQHSLVEGDRLIMRGEQAAMDAFAEQHGLTPCQETIGKMREALFNDSHGFSEVVLPPRSRLIGETVFPGMVTESGDLIILGVQRGGENLGPGEAVLAAGDTLLLQGRWEALEEYGRDPNVLVVAAPDMIRSQARPLGTGSMRAIVILAVMVTLLATGVVPRVVAGLAAACAVILLRVLKIERAYRAINWNVLIMVASLIPLSTAMYKTGAAYLIADTLVAIVGNASPYALLAGLFLLTALIGQLISSTATTLIVIPIAIASAEAVGVSPRTALVTVAVAAAASFLTPIAASASLMVQGPGGYRFGDFWRMGLPLLLWFFLVGTFLVPMLWPFAG
ncbi:di/tricarboxylate transporter [Bradyrhizobium japonicum USDA 38]|uniref:SLC13 family permease n=1 Tax=Bradyrhizobium japonicum TaxID=375 RepID=UPI000409EE44|nr:SLC13 family permease [Bradyrhizobium japonicum]MCS3894147.1 di/tricarboxylate transporter [Bradyrhizobium japonicum USDA 38]MCS3946661.1 di/tricarboxylate transporter [Bradyrhizobium japonicum]MCW2220564.1 di/tricarboxylate transporter [Bradyrhizobium japonicum]MCW2345178.1 di/tricarboxylate transporter [Bradyrhizobium japonicum]